MSSYRLRIGARWAVVTLVALGQWQIARVPAVAAGGFDEWAREIERTQAWRYGYVLQYHSPPWLVKARTTPADPPLVPPAADDDRSAMMVRELRLTPWKAWLELMFYGALWAVYAKGLPRLASAWRNERRHRPPVELGVLALVRATVALAPFLIAGYGDSSVTYHLVVVFVMTGPMVAFSWALPWFSTWDARATAFVGIVMFYGAGRLCLGWCFEVVDALQARRRAAADRRASGHRERRRAGPGSEGAAVVKTLMGGETEFALSALRVGEHPVNQPEFLRQFMAHARGSLPFTSISENGRFVGNGGMLYLDHGLHIEWSTPEVTSPRDIVRYLRAGDELVHGLAADVLRAQPALTGVFCTRCNVDYGQRTQWASHESYLHTCEPTYLPDQLLPFLASRVVISGAGGWDCQSPGLHFTLSPRAHVITEVTGIDTQAARPLFHLKDETLSRTGSHRLHVCCSETLCSDVGTLLRFGATALVLALVDAGGRPGDAVGLVSPLTALRRFAIDANCRAKASVRDGRHLTAIDIQRHYLDQVEQFSSSGGGTGIALPDWAGEILVLWRRTLDDLETGPSQVDVVLDWAIKTKVYARWLQQRGISWASLPDWNVVIRELQRTWGGDHPHDHSFDLNQVVALDGPIAETVAKVRPMIEERGLDADLLPALARARSELFEIDTRFGSLGDDGIFRALDASGVLKHRVPGLNLSGAADAPPVGTRAKIRGDVVRRLSANGTKYIAEWTRIVDLDNHLVLDIGDPFETEERWTALERLGVEPRAADGMRA